MQCRGHWRQDRDAGAAALPTADSTPRPAGSRRWASEHDIVSCRGCPQGLLLRSVMKTFSQPCRKKLYGYQKCCVFCNLRLLVMYIWHSFCLHSPRVAFCGYSIPHPADKKVNIRVQTTGTMKWNIILEFCCFLCPLSNILKAEATVLMFST